MAPPLRIGFVPEHFSTPLHFARLHYGLSADLVAFPSGTGAMIAAVRAGELDVAIGLTEGWIAGLGKPPPPGAESPPAGAGTGSYGYRLIGTYVTSPLCWAILMGSQRADEQNAVADLRGAKVGVSRIGSGSYVMAHVLAEREGWLAAGDGEGRRGLGEFVVLNDFARLRAGVNSGEADFFMWEHFTSKRYLDSGEIRRAGEIYTPWASWMIVAAESLLAGSGGGGEGGAREVADLRLEDFFVRLDRGVRHFAENVEEAVEYISTELDYSEADAREWLGTVRFAEKTEGVDVGIVRACVGVLKTAGVLKDGEGLGVEEMIASVR